MALAKAGQCQGTAVALLQEHMPSSHTSFAQWHRMAAVSLGSQCEQGEMMGERGVLHTGSQLGLVEHSEPCSAACTMTQTHPMLPSWTR